MVRSCKGIEMLVNLINISYCAMKILPYQNEHFSEYRTKSVQEFRFELSQGIRSQIFFATFLEKVENRIKSSQNFNNFNDQHLLEQPTVEDTKLIFLHMEFFHPFHFGSYQVFLHKMCANLPHLQ